MLATFRQVLIVKLQTEIPTFLFIFCIQQMVHFGRHQFSFYMSHTQFEIKTDNLFCLEDYTIQVHLTEMEYLHIRLDYCIQYRITLRRSWVFYACCCVTHHEINHVKMLNLFCSVFQNDIFDCDCASINLRSIYISNQPFVAHFAMRNWFCHHVIESNGGDKRRRRRTQRVCKEHELNNVPLFACVCVSRSLPLEVCELFWMEMHTKQRQQQQ